MKITDIHWLAGLLDGEGCISLRVEHYKSKSYPLIGIHLVMTDKGPVAKAANLFMCKVYEYKIKSGKIAYRTNVYGKEAASWLMTLYPLLCERRQAKARECIAAWKAAPTRSGKREKVL